MQTEAKNPIKALHKSFRIVESLHDEGPTTIADLAERLSLPKSTVHSHLTTLQELGYVVKHDDAYELGLKFLDLGGRSRRRLPLFKLGKDEIDRLARETGEVTNLVTEENGLEVRLYQAEGERSFKRIVGLDFGPHAGHRGHMHNTGTGKAILAYRPHDYVEWVVNEWGLPPRTEATIVDPDALYAELDRVRDRGYALDDEESFEGLRCVAVPVQDGEGRAVGAVSISSSADRLDDSRVAELHETIRDACQRLEFALQHG